MDSAPGAYLFLVSSMAVAQTGFQQMKASKISKSQFPQPWSRDDYIVAMHASKCIKGRFLLLFTPNEFLEAIMGCTTFDEAFQELIDLKELMLVAVPGLCLMYQLDMSRFN